jgi:ureidoglycolate hydrolase
MYHSVHSGLRPRDLEEKAFAPYGQIIRPRRAGGQFEDHPYDPESGNDEAQLSLTAGVPRLWVMHLDGPRLRFSNLARHRRVSQCLGSLQAKDWFIAVAPPSNPADGAQPDLTRLIAFRVTHDCVVKLNVGTWHAGPLFFHRECLFFNLENLDTNKRDFNAVELPSELEIVDEQPDSG